MAFGLPAIDTIKDLLTGSTTDKLKEFIEPFALVNAGIFLILNLALVLPMLDVASGDQFVATIFGWSGAWLAVIGSVTVLLLSYVINNLNSFFLDLISAEVFRKTPFLGPALLGRQRIRFHELKDSLDGESPEDNKSSSDKSSKDTLQKQIQREERNERAYRLAYEFPAREAELGLNRLGNLLLSPGSYVSHQYGASTEIVWPILHESLGNDSKLIKPVQESWNSLQFFTTLSALLLVVMVEIILVGIYGSQLTSQTLLRQLILLLLGVLTSYYLASQKARRWGSALRRVFDANMDTALEQLGMESLKGINPSSPELKAAWKKVSTWLAYGAIREEIKADPNWYKAPSELKPLQLSHPDYLSVDPFSQYELTATASKDRKKYDLHEGMRYRFALSNTKLDEKAPSGKGAYLIARDKRLSPSAEPAPAKLYINSDYGYGTSLGNRIIDIQGEWETGDPPGILFPLGNIIPGSSRILRFENKVHLGAVEVDPPGYVQNVQIVKAEEDYELRLKPSITFVSGSRLSVQIELMPEAQLELGMRAFFDKIVKGKLEGSNRKGKWTFTGFGEEEKDIAISCYRVKEEKAGQTTA
jgi:hypothetical protein